MTDETDLTGLIRRRSRRLRPRGTGLPTNGRFPHPPRAVLFDVYGTLLVRRGETSAPGRSRDSDLKRLCTEHRLRMAPRELITAIDHSISVRHKRAQGSGIPNPEVDIVDVWRSLFPGRSVHELRLLIVDYELTRFPCWAMPGARRLLRGLVGRGIRIGIVSNAQFYTPLYLAAILGKDPEALGFDPSLCLYSWQFGRAKPDTFLFDTAASRLSLLGIERRSTVMIGNDPRNDIDAASRAGFMTALVAAERPDNRHGAHGLQRPDVVLGRLDDLLSRA